MARRIFNTYNAPEEETEGVKAALDVASISYYETCKGKWGIGSAALWVSDEKHYHEARAVIDVFQQEWIENIRQQSVPTNINWLHVPALLIVVAAVLCLTFFWYF